MRVHYNVNPRYTAGSPAMVDEGTARRVAEEEKHSVEHALSGAWGIWEKERAERDGLGPTPDPRGVRRSIAEEVEEHRDHWMVTDLLTLEAYQRPFVAGKPPKHCAKCAARKELEAWVRGTTP